MTFQELDAGLGEIEAALAQLTRRLTRLGRLLTALADGLDAAPRHGADTDEPEGARYVLLSDTLARAVAGQLRGLATAEPPA